MGLVKVDYHGKEVSIQEIDFDSVTVVTEKSKVEEKSWLEFIQGLDREDLNLFLDGIINKFDKKVSTN